jgi:hypothetical protein
VIVKGGARRAGAFFAKHLMKAEENERVTITEIKGLYAEDLPEAFRELKALAAGSRGQDFFYHASINPREDERLTPEQWDFAVDRLEQNLGMDGHARFQVEHEKEGRTHRHIVWSRVDPETMTLANHWRNYEAHDKTRAELEQAFSHEPTPPTPEPSQRKSREIADWENFRAAESGIDPKEVKAEVTSLWQRSDSGAAFVGALEHAGYTLCQGDKGYCIIDQAGDVHSLARRIDGVKTAQIRERLSDISLTDLPTVAEASAAVKARNEAEEGDSTAGATEPTAEEQSPQQEPRTWGNPKFALLYKYAHDHPALAPPEPSGYISPATAQEFAAHQENVLPYLDNQAAQEHQHAWHTLEARRAELPAPQAAHDELWEEWLSRHPEQDKELER